eukprot:scaffold9650_cov50-Cyclotella_meneghiniana.AAC.3
MEGLLDAQSGEVYFFIDKGHYLESKGGVFPISNDNLSSDGIQQSGWPIAYMNVGNEVTDTGGNDLNTGSVTIGAHLVAPTVLHQARAAAATHIQTEQSSTSLTSDGGG